MKMEGNILSEMSHKKESHQVSNLLVRKKNEGWEVENKEEKKGR